MLLERNVQWTRVSVATDDEVRWLRKWLSFSTSTDRFRTGGTASTMYQEAARRFPAGITPLVVEGAKGDGLPVSVMDVRVAPCSGPDLSVPLAWLRPYQREALDRAIAARTGILWLPTGSGKTEIAAALVRVFPTVRWLFVAHRTNLAVQAAERFELRGREHGVPIVAGRVVEGAVRVPPDARVVCATFASLAALRDRGHPAFAGVMAGCRGLIVDECHTGAADNIFSVILASSAYYRIGLSGTPLDRTDRRSLVAQGAIGPVVYRLETARLIQEGVLAKPRVKMVRVSQPGNEDEWSEAYTARIVQSPLRNGQVLSAVAKLPGPCMVFVRQTAHGATLAAALARAGYRTVYVQGSTSTADRVAAVAAIDARTVDVVVASSVFNEGVDAPGLRSIVVAAGGKSFIEVLQRIGRGTRRSAGKDTIEVVDFLDIGCGCTRPPMTAPPHRGCSWVEEHAQQRRVAYIREGFEVTEETWTPPPAVPAPPPPRKA